MNGVIKKLIIGCTLLNYGSMVISMEPSENKIIQKTKEYGSVVSKAYLAYYAMNFLGTIAHENGHAIAARLLFNAKPTITLNYHLYGVSGVTDWPTFRVNDFKDKKIAIAYLAGPAAGMLGCYLILKLGTALEEYKETKDIKQAFYAMLNKPLINSSQSNFLKFALLSTFMGDINSLLPSYVGSDMNCMLKDLKWGALYENNPLACNLTTQFINLCLSFYLSNKYMTK